MTFRRSCSVGFAGWLLPVLMLAHCVAEDPARLEPSDPFASVGGIPIRIGEVNLILARQVGARRLPQIAPEVRRATAAVLLRRHRAMTSLEKAGGESLRKLLDRHVDAVRDRARSRGRDLADMAKLRGADEASLISELQFNEAWRRYLSSQVNESTLRRFFDRHADRYGAKTFDISQIFVPVEAGDDAAQQSAITEVRAIRSNVLDASDRESAFAEARGASRVGAVGRAGDLPDSVLAAVRTTEAGEVTPPIVSPLGVHLVFVHEIIQQPIAFEDLTDRAALRRDLADALFESLVRRSADEPVVWFIDEYRPPTAGVATANP